MSTKVVVASKPPCDFCGDQAQYDARTTKGSWANMCESCFTIFGVSLGTGKGQRLLLQEEWDAEAEGDTQGDGMPTSDEELEAMLEESLYEGVVTLPDGRVVEPDSPLSPLRKMGLI